MDGPSSSTMAFVTAMFRYEIALQTIFGLFYHDCYPFALEARLLLFICAIITVLSI